MSPQAAKVYALLKVRGPDGVTQRDASRWANCDRLAARIHDLKDEGYEFDHVDEPNGNGGKHRRYFLKERPAPMRGVQTGWTSDNLDRVPETEARLLWGDR